jgi:(1->4)-alpha-D-glucan 1-alpha-D-glucosylmutase
MKKKIPTSSYRLNLSKSFNFEKATKVLPFLKNLGVEMIYTNPIFERVLDSNNPYMIVSPLKIANELLGEKGFLSFAKECKKLSLQLMMDIVPNHMAANLENPWWRDVVEKKEKSKYAIFFDIDWEWGNGEIILPSSENIHARINYRRFFDICDMVGLNIQESEVYAAYFSKIKEYVSMGLIDGFRIDHIDGLKYPKEFLEKVSEDFPHLYIAIEKILPHGESLPKDWKCDGTVGYEFLYLIDQVLLDKDGEEVFTDLYEEYKEEEVDLVEIKISYLNHYLISEVNRFANIFSVEKENFLQFLSHFLVYRTYFDADAKRPKDLKAIEYAASFTTGTFFKEDILKRENREYLLKLQQILPAIYAKGFEDTYNYRYLRFTSLNEVGGEPNVFSISNQLFHQSIQNIFQNFPNSMHTLSTHDTKRSLDARMRIHCLAEIGKEYGDNLETWMKIVEPFESKRIMYFFFQTLIAISQDNLLKRITDYMIKSVREGKYYSDHLLADVEFEQKMKDWIEKVLNNKPFMSLFSPFKEKIVKAAELKSICALVLQIGLFGVMDLYQGEELLNANLVDPDNRREVDFEARKKAFEEKSSLKMEVIRKGLLFRSKYRDLILKGSYEPLQTKESQVGYIRKFENMEVCVIVNKFHLGRKAKQQIPIMEGELLFSEAMPFLISIKS